MAYQDGTWTIAEGVLPGARINVVSKNKVPVKESGRGIVAAPLELNWGVDTNVRTFEPLDYTRDAMQVFGYEAGSEEIKEIGELFCGATKVVVARLNGNGEYAKSSVGVAKYPGVRGNDIAVTIEADPDMGTEENPVAKSSAKIAAKDNTIEVTFNNTPEGFAPSASISYQDTVILTSDATDQNKITLTLPGTLEPGEYIVVASLKKGTVNYTLNTASVNVTIDPETHVTINLTKGEETPGEEDVGKETVEIEKHGFVKTKAELDTVIGAGTSAKIDHDTNVFYIYFKEKQADARNYLVQFEVDSKVYACNFADAQGSLIGLGKGAAHNTDLDYAKDGATWKAHDKTEVNVTGKTVKLSLLKYSKETSLEVINSETPITVIEPVDINCAASVAKGSKTATLREAMDVEFEVTDNQIVATINNKPDNYLIGANVRVASNDAILAYTTGVLELTEEDNKRIVTVTPKLGAQNLKLEISAIKQAKGEKRKILKTLAFTTALEGEDKPATAKPVVNSEDPEEFPEIVPRRYIVTTYVGGIEVDRQKNKSLENIKDNNFVIFDRTKPLEETGGALFTGGTNSEVTVESYTDCLNKLESYYFHCLACVSSDEEIMQMFVNYTTDCRERGIKFQTVMAQTEAPPNNEAIIQVYNHAIGVPNPESALVPWVAGQEAGCEVQNTVSNVEYDGRYTVDLNHTQRELENAVLDGYFCFHQARGIDHDQHCKTLLDVNTLIDYDEDQNESWSRNETIRVTDDICIHLADVFNNRYFGIVKNNDTGREMFKNEVISYLDELQTKGALDSYDSDYITVTPALNPAAIIVQAAITVMHGLEQLYMTLVIE